MRGKWFLLTIVLLIGLNASQVQGADKEQPSMELLEFLGSWETEGGEWIDPTELDDTTPPAEEQEDEKGKDS